MTEWLSLALMGAEMLAMLVLMPFWSWLVESLPVFCSGQRGLPFRLTVRRAFVFLWTVGRGGINFKEGFCFVFLGLALMSLPGFSLDAGLSQKALTGFLSDPLLIGGGLLLVRFFLVPAESVSVSAGGAFALLWLYLLLLLMAPYIHDLSMLAGHGNASLNGALTCSALALMLSVPVPVSSELVRVPRNLAEFDACNRYETERKRGLLIFFQGLWIVFLSDLVVLPGGDSTGLASLGSFLGRVMMVIMIITLCRLTGMEKNLRPISLLLGLGLLFALAGRFAS
ncbi:hypothetical protein PT277_07795 [Acetobacteraceae bacterium ESL0709]|nr:hypothetical protein [Acetobacteraceae bacterium ESL0697]MDF7678581.1 hypothetical protein [Acetobacteraceae bacterium ESL0709]